MNEQADKGEQLLLAGRCGFCGAEVPENVQTCPECGREVAGGLTVRPRRPVWVRPLAVLMLALILLGLVACVGYLLRP